MKRKEIIFKSKWVRYVGMLAIGGSLALYSCDNSASNNSESRTGYDKDTEMVEEGQGAGSSEDAMMQQEGDMRDTTSDLGRGSSTDPSVREGVGSGTMSGEVESDEMRGSGVIHRGSGTATTDINEGSESHMQEGQGSGADSDMMQGSGVQQNDKPQNNKQQNKKEGIGAGQSSDVKSGSGNSKATGNNHLGEERGTKHDNLEKDTLGDFLEGHRDPARGAGTGKGIGMGTGAGTWQGTPVDTMIDTLHLDRSDR